MPKSKTKESGLAAFLYSNWREYGTASHETTLHRLTINPDGSIRLELRQANICNTHAVETYRNESLAMVDLYLEISRIRYAKDVDD